MKLKRLQFVVATAFGLLVLVKLLPTAPRGVDRFGVK